jgi:hypothetical protein
MWQRMEPRHDPCLDFKLVCRGTRSARYRQRGPRDRALKGDRLLFDLIMKFKVDCPEIQEYSHVSQYNSLINTSHMHLAAFNHLTQIKSLPDT